MYLCICGISAKGAWCERLFAVYHIDVNRQMALTGGRRSVGGGWCVYFGGGRWCFRGWWWIVKRQTWPMPGPLVRQRLSWPRHRHKYQMEFAIMYPNKWFFHLPEEQSVFRLDNIQIQLNMPGTAVRKNVPWILSFFFSVDCFSCLSTSFG